MKKVLITAGIFLLSTALNANATSITSVEGYTVSGSDMAGMVVSVVYADGSAENQTWEADAGDRGKAVSSQWSLEFDGADTYQSNYYDNVYSYWVFDTDVAVASFTIDAIVGDIVFDIFETYDYYGVTTGFYDTSGSEAGWWQENADVYDNTSGVFFSPGVQPYWWSFSDAIDINGKQAEDLWGSLTISFDNPFTSYVETFKDTFIFGVDTDVIAPVPEPGTIVLLGCGLFGLAGIGRKRAKNAK